MNRFCRIFDTPVSQVLVRIGINDDDDKSSLFVSCTLNGMYIEAVITLEQDDEAYALAKLDEFNEATALNFVHQMQESFGERTFADIAQSDEYAP